MSALALMTLISLYAKYLGASDRPMISLTPNWATIFKGDSINLTCNVYFDVQENPYSWYKNGEKIHSARTITIQDARETNSGNYQCQAGASEKSDAIRLDVKNDDIMLQAPPRINEGDVLNLRCHSRRTKGVITTIFFHEDKILQSPGADPVLLVGKVRRNATGTYRCAKKFGEDTLLFAEEFISVRDSEVKPLVSLSPNWVPLLTKDFIQLTCDIGSTQEWKQTFYWYKDGKSLEWNQKSLIVSADEEDNGNYQCQTDASERSDPLRLDVRNDLLILQTPPTVHEGDFLKLRCHNWPGYNEINTTFYKDRNIIQSRITDSVSHLGRANISASGKYRCEKQIYYNELYYNLSAEVNISISELFSTPQIKVSPDQVTEGDHMTITCDTKLSPHRATTELQFAFYRNGHNVQGFSLSSNFTISSAHHMDSGNYACEVQTPTGSVRKMSKGTYIQMHGRTSLENIIRLGLSGLLLVIIVWLLLHQLKSNREVYSEKEKECSLSL